MTKKTLILLPVALVAALPFSASAETMDATELDMFSAASLTLQQASDAALQAHSGALAAVAFGEENGRATYEAVVVGSDGQPWTILMDANTGEVFASGLSTSMDDDEDDGQDHEDGQDMEGSDGNANDSETD